LQAAAEAINLLYAQRIQPRELLVSEEGEISSGA